MRIQAKDYSIEFKADQETMQKLFDKMLKFYLKHEAFNGESICQCDNPQIEAPELLSEIAEEIFQFKVDWNE